MRSTKTGSSVAGAQILEAAPQGRPVRRCGESGCSPNSQRGSDASERRRESASPRNRDWRRAGPRRRQILRCCSAAPGRPGEAMELLDDIFAEEPAGPWPLESQGRDARTPRGFRRGDRAVREGSSEMTRRSSQKMSGWSYGHMLKTVGAAGGGHRSPIGRRSRTSADALGEAWWSLANLKTVKVRRPRRRTAMAMRSCADEASASWQTRIDSILEFRAFQQRRCTTPAEPMTHSIIIRAGQCASTQASAPMSRGMIDRYRKTDNFHRGTISPREAFARTTTGGCNSPEPGSSFLECRAPARPSSNRFLSSHSQVEGTSEPPDIPHPCATARCKDPGAALDLNEDERRALGEEYLKRARRFSAGPKALLHRQASATTGCSFAVHPA